jgi:hypothetical protein
MNFFIVDFNKTASNKVCFACLIFCNCYDLTEGSGNDTLQLLIVRNTHHCVCFSATCLSIGEDSSIVAIQYTVDKGESALFVD